MPEVIFIYYDYSTLSSLNTTAELYYYFYLNQIYILKHLVTKFNNRIN